MKTSSNLTPDYNKLVFAENSQRQNVYDLTYSTKEFNKFKYFRIENPRQEYLIKQGAKYVCESWSAEHVKTLHTGLINTGYKNYYFGDHLEIVNGKSKTSLMIFHFIEEDKIFELFYFNHFNKCSVRLKLNFLREFLNSSIKK